MNSGVNVNFQKGSSAEMQLSLCFVLFCQWIEERFNIHLIGQYGGGIFEMLIARIIARLKEIYLHTSASH